MAKQKRISVKAITITIPRELDSLIDRLVKESKTTPKPISKSQFIAVACYDYLERSIKILEAQNNQKKKEEIN